MAWAQPYTEDEINYIRAQLGAMTPAEIAEKLGRSKRGINNKIKELGIEPKQQEAQSAPPQGGGDQTLEDLLELRALIRAQMLEAGPQALAKLSGEYRAVLEAIDRRRPGGEEEGKPDDIGQILLSFKLPGAD